MNGPSIVLMFFCEKQTKTVKITLLRFLHFTDKVNQSKQNPMGNIRTKRNSNPILNFISVSVSREKNQTFHWFTRVFDCFIFSCRVLSAKLDEPYMEITWNMHGPR